MWPKIGWATKVTAFAVLSGILPNVLSYSQKEKIKKKSLCYASWRTFLKQLGELWRMEGKRVGANKEYNFLLFP